MFYLLVREFQLILTSDCSVKLCLMISINSSHPSADCSRHLILPSLFPMSTILVTKYKGFLCNLFLLWELTLNLDLRGLGRDKESEGGARFIIFCRWTQENE